MRILHFLIAFIAFLSLNIPSVYGCEAVRTDAWYFTDIIIDRTTVPQELEITGYSNHQSGYYLANRTEEPVYIVTKNYPTWKSAGAINAQSIADKGFYKLVSGKVFYLLKDGVGDNERWEQLTDGNYVSPAKLPIEQNLYIIDGQNQQNYGFGRPAKSVPSPNELRILGHYKGSGMEIAGKLIYSLNDHYKPESKNNIQVVCSPSEYRKSAFDQTSYFMLIAFGFLLASLVWKSFRRKKGSDIFQLFNPFVR